MIETVVLEKMHQKPVNIQYSISNTHIQYYCIVYFIIANFKAKHYYTQAKKKNHNACTQRTHLPRIEVKLILVGQYFGTPFLKK